MNRPEPPKYTVVLLEFKTKAGAVERLQEAFKIDLATARHFVDNAPVVVKRNADTKLARTYVTKLEEIGAVVELRKNDPKKPSPRTGMSFPIVTPGMATNQDKPSSRSGSNLPSFGSSSRSSSNLPTFGSGSSRSSSNLPTFSSFGASQGPAGAEPAAGGPPSLSYNDDPSKLTAYKSTGTLRSPYAEKPSSRTSSKSSSDLPGLSYNDDPNALPDRAAPPPLVVSQPPPAQVGPRSSSVFTRPKQFQSNAFGDTPQTARESTSMVPPMMQGFQPSFQSRMSGAIDLPEDIFGSGEGRDNTPNALLGNQPMAPAGSRLSGTQTGLPAFGSQLPASSGGESNDLEDLFKSSGIPHQPPPRVQPRFGGEPGGQGGFQRTSPFGGEESDGRAELMTSVAPGASNNALRAVPDNTRPSSGNTLDDIAGDLPTGRKPAETTPSAFATGFADHEIESGPTLVEEVTFWPGVGAAFLVPFRGISWLLLMGLVLTISAFVSLMFGFYGLIPMVLLFFFYIGLLFVYYGRAAQAGIRGEDSPELGNVGEAFLEPMTMIIPGLVMTFLVAALFTPAVFIAGSQLMDSAENVEQISRPIEDTDIFFDDDGNELDLEELSTAVVGYTTADASSPQVSVDPVESTVTRLDIEPPEPPGIPAQGWLMIILALLLPAFYLPMSMVVGSTTGSFSNMFNPFLIIQGIVNGGLPYVFIVFLGIGIYAGASATGEFLSASDSLPIQLAGLIISALALTYVVGVQGYLMGRLIGSRAEEFDDFIS